MHYDLLLKNGRIVDPSQNLNLVGDVAFKNGRVAHIGDRLPSAGAATTVDCTDLIVTPGWIDLHVHAYWGVSHYGIENPDEHCISRGVTTALDAGSAGADTFPGFQRYVIENAFTRMFALVNISRNGMLNFDIGETANLDCADVDRAVETAQHHRDVIKGVKVRLTRMNVNPDAGLEPLYRAREAADRAKVPLYVHPQEALCDSLDDILAVMKAGDLVTHCFHDTDCGILDDSGQLRSSVWEAVDRGVFLDVGHGMGSFSWDTARKALAQGFTPTTISSDVHIHCIQGPCFDLATTASKFLHLGLDLDQVIARVTDVPARFLKAGERLGTLKPGSYGDAAIFELQEGQFRFFDGTGEMRNGEWVLVNDGCGHMEIGDRRFNPRHVVRQGRLYK